MTAVETVTSEPRATTPPRWPVRLFAATATAMALMVLMQATTAGQFLSGNALGLTLHREAVFMIITWVALAELVAAVLVVRPGRGSPWVLAVAALNIAAVVVQIYVGFTNQLALHVPLGVSILALNVLVAVKAPALARLARRRQPA
jgi:hypothetical protein